LLLATPTFPVPVRNKADFVQPPSPQHDNTRWPQRDFVGASGLCANPIFYRRTTPIVCRVCTQISRPGRIFKPCRTLTTVCAKFAHAHLSFGRLIAESARATAQ